MALLNRRRKTASCGWTWRERMMDAREVPARTAPSAATAASTAGPLSTVEGLCAARPRGACGPLEAGSPVALPRSPVPVLALCFHAATAKSSWAESGHATSHGSLARTRQRTMAFQRIFLRDHSHSAATFPVYGNCTCEGSEACEHLSVIAHIYTSHLYQYTIIQSKHLF